ncbi:nuclear transport factor 2 family protein [Ruegeria sp. 6PALISEP08]|uniref:nuclear transport factor 2 family protein n=1 Tax=Ruegeria sp. 6PALISEP08 TaxID=1225660 RepID=UPI00067F6B12|nr:nuclear transport factor 2 family protein [Ruegeria sp. 6PALISEP08]
MSIQEIGREFLEACDTGKGWDGCKDFCHEGATFSAQADALADVTTLEGYADWMKGLLTPIPDGHYELKSFSTDDERGIVNAFAVFHGTHSVDGPVPATWKKLAADYVYAIEFDGDKISHMTKIWNDTHSLKQLGWA